MRRKAFGKLSPHNKLMVSHVKLGLQFNKSGKDWGCIGGSLFNGKEFFGLSSHS